MGSRRGQLALAAAVVLGAVLAASSAPAARLPVLVRSTPNRTDTNRTARTIDAIVIHDTEGTFDGSIRHLQNPRVDGSAHFVVSRRGQVVQLVPVTDVAWHSGNAWWNLHSIGIEHEGWADRNAYTEAEYRASAELVAYLAHRWGIPLDRKHVIGHAEVPDPYHPRLRGGFAHHTDPGPHWNWRHYMALVHYYSAHRVLPRFVHPAQPRTSVVDRHAEVRGKAQWWSGIDAALRARRHIYRVDFVVDGRTLYTDHTWPFSFNRDRGWDTTTVANGRHMLVVLAYGTRRYRIRKRVPVRVVNPPLRARLAGVGAGSTLSGDVTVGVRPSEPVERVTLYVDGRPVSRDATAPYTLSWSTTTASEGPHSVLVYVRGLHGRRAAERLPVIVANSPSFPDTLAASWVPRPAAVDG